MLTNLPSYANLLEQVNTLDVARYAKTRNFYDGHVSRLSPYISRGILSLPRIKSMVLKNADLEQARSFISELAWREYFQRIWWKHGNTILNDFYHEQSPVEHYTMITALATATTGLQGVDEPLRQLLETGYMHNHARMYVASLACNIGRAHWLQPARWMYYHLNDGDLASNMLSWQWVAGTFSNKKYYFNQENLNRFSGITQTGTFMDCSYEELGSMSVPPELKETESGNLVTTLPIPAAPKFDYTLPLLVYNSYNLDPEWRSDEPANRILLLEPSHFHAFPVSSRVLDFIIRAAQTYIPGIQLVTDEFQNIPGLTQFPNVYFRQHPTTLHYQGTGDENAWMFPGVEPKSSFFSFWKVCEKQLWRERRSH